MYVYVFLIYSTLRICLLHNKIVSSSLIKVGYGVLVWLKVLTCVIIARILVGTFSFKFSDGYFYKSGSYLQSGMNIL